jgi:hypothetical protein
MRSSTEQQVEVPYSAVGKKLLECIFDALDSILDVDLNNVNNDEIETGLKGIFNAVTSTVIDPHLKNDSRLCKILLTAYRNVQENSQSSEGCCIPSPLSILYQMLTVPDEPQSAAYALLFCRSLLYETFKVFPEHPLFPDSHESFDYEKISTSLHTFVNYARKGDNIPETESKPAQSMLAHYLALKHIFYMRFKDEGEVSKYLKSKVISTNSDGIKIEFHKFTYYNDLPDTSSLMNELSGIPIPLKGLDTVFQGGLRTKSNSNLVMRISGQPGSGKTSFALALAASMSPFGTFTCYLSLGEEEPADLKNRLKSLIPEYLKKLSIYPARDGIDSWFLSNNVSVIWNGHNNEDKKTVLDNLAQNFDEIFSILKKKQECADKSYFPSVCPLIIIIDSIRPFLKEDFNKFVEKCRRLQSLIILISPNDEQYHNDIDYMVDAVINLKQVGSDEPAEKPIRILQLTKTRYQSARHGAHVFHLSGKNGIRVSPQLPSQIDKREIVSNRLPSDTVYTNFFNEYSGNPPVNGDSPCLQIWDKSQILLHGYGSTGKAGLALTLLLYPFKIKGKLPEQEDMEITSKRKILIVSLLYPEDYYNKLEKKIKKSFKDKIQDDAQIECICFYSGHISSEDFIGKILNKLDRAALEGEPFTGILLDGLHNAILQFPKLQRSDMVWSTLYSLLTRYYLTILTTYTNFIIENDKNKEDKFINKEDKFLLKGGEVLLDILFQSADYSFTVRKPNHYEKKFKKGQYIVTLKSAIKHKIGINDENFLWDREDLLLEEFLSPNPPGKDDNPKQRELF